MIRSRFMKTGDIIFAKTHAEFLNKIFGTSYKAWMRCVWNYSDDLIVWMVRFNSVKNGWRNSFISDDRIMEENLDNVTEWNGMPIENMHRRRLVVEIVDVGRVRKYVFRGVFVYDQDNSDPRNVRYHDKVSDEFIIY